MNAVKLRITFIASIVLGIAAIGALIYYAGRYLESETSKTVHAKIDAELSSQDLERLKNLRKVLDDNKESVEKAAQIVSDSKQYQYQDQIVSDINAYAAKSGVQVNGYDFGTIEVAGKPSAPTSSTTTKLPTVAGVKSISVTLTLSSPLPYDNYLRFIKEIENNLTKMQISGIDIVPDADNANNISNPSVVLIVYTR